MLVIVNVVNVNDNSILWWWIKNVIGLDEDDLVGELPLK